MIKEPKLLRLFSHGEYCTYVTRDEIQAYGYRLDDEDMELNWKIACVYFSDSTDEDGICNLDMDKMFDGNTTDLIKSTTSFMIVYTLMKYSDRVSLLPVQVLKQGIIYSTAKLAEIQIAIFKEEKINRLLSFEIEARSVLLVALDGNMSFDDCYDRIFSHMPSPRCFSGLDDENRAEFRELFETLIENTKYCSTSYYVDILRQYVDVITR